MDIFDEQTAKEETSGFAGGMGDFGGTTNMGVGGAPNWGSGGTSEPKKNNKLLKRIIVGSLCGLLAVGGVSTFVLVKKNQEKKAHQQELVEKKMEDFSKSLSDAVESFNLSALESKGEKISLWDLNLSYVESSEIRTQLVQKLGSLVKVSLDNATGSVEVKYPNFEYLAMVIKNHDGLKVQEYVKDLDKSAHTYKTDLVDKLSGYLLEHIDDMLTYKGDYVQFYLQEGDVPKPYKTTVVDEVVEDGKLTDKLSKRLDKLVFSSDSFHELSDTFGAVASGYLGEATETEEHAEWVTGLGQYGDFSKTLVGVLVDGETEGVELDSLDSSAVVDSALTTKEEYIRVEPRRYVWFEGEKELEKQMNYSWVGSSYIVSDDSDALVPVVSKGKGSYDEPYTFGTPFVTKAMGTDNEYHDVKVTVTGIKIGDDAIKDVLTYDERNQGFTLESDLVLATFTFIVENLEDKEIEINSEFTLSDSGLNLTPRTGNMYSMPERAKIEARGVAKMADWVYAKDVKTLSLVWGKTFNRQFEAPFMNTLGDEVFDKYGRSIDRVSKALVENEAQKKVDELKAKVEESKRN